MSQTPVQWDWKAASEKKTDGTYLLRFTVNVPKGMYLYEPGLEIADLATTLIQFSDSSVIQTPIQTKEGLSRSILSTIFEGQRFNIIEGKVVWETTVDLGKEVPETLIGTLQFTYGNDEEFYPLESFPFEIGMEGGAARTFQLKLDQAKISTPLNACGTSGEQTQTGLMTIFFLGFLGGLIALLTPCVFPMIPLTVSFFTKKADSSKGTFNALLYGFFIFLIYIIFSLPFHIIGKVSPTIYNDISTNIWLNLSFFLVFIAFAISFFGYYEITLPSGLANSANARQGGNVLGIFFMALTLAIVSFSCTGPILGTLLVGAASEGAWPLTAGMAGFGLALGLPFALFAMFPNWLSSIPKSGGWLNTVKVVLGFIELALALKFLSNADLVAHWGILPRELFFGIWIVIGLGLAAYLMGWIRFPHDSPHSAFSLARKLFTTVVIAFTLYLIPGISNTRWANLSLVSGFPPPTCYSLYKNPINCEEPLKDLEEAKKIARETGKPILIDFTGWACVNCRKMEENVWVKPEVKKLMDQYVLVSLYVDDKKKLPISQQYSYLTKDGINKRIVTVGDKWATFQTENFNASSQPWYVAITSDDLLLTSPVGYTPSSTEFSSWLNCGLSAFKNQSK